MTTRTWKQAFQNRAFVKSVAFNIFALTCALCALRLFLAYNETRQGYAFADPVLRLFQPRDFTWVTFSLIMASTVFGIALIFQDPYHALSGVCGYTCMLVMRIFSISLLPLQPPPGMIFLQDPLVAFFTSHATPVKDLFFSGHTATAFLLFFVVKSWRPVFLASAILIGTLVIWQHVHYSIDVLAAPLFSYLAMKLGKKLTELSGVRS